MKILAMVFTLLGSPFFFVGYILRCVTFAFSAGWEMAKNEGHEAAERRINRTKNGG